MSQQEAKFFPHPKPLLNKLSQYTLALALALIVVSAPLQVVLGLAIPQGRLFILTGVLSLLLVLPLLMGLFVHPSLSVSDEGITLHPIIGGSRFVRWDEIHVMKDYPLLPSEDMEANRRQFVGRKNYRPAQGKMLVIPSLPFPYRPAGWFAGEGFTGIIALTNRAHLDYDNLIKLIAPHVESA